MKYTSVMLGTYIQYSLSYYSENYLKSASIGFVVVKCVYIQCM